MDFGKHKVIFEGVELAGKSYLMSQVYDFLEKKYNSRRSILDGCHWFNSDVGIFGTEYGLPVIRHYLAIAEILKDKNLMFEKLHLSDQVYHEFSGLAAPDFAALERRLVKLGAKIIFCSVQPEPKIFARRLKERLALYPHYRRIMKEPPDYIRLQTIYQKYLSRSRLPALEVDLTVLPNPRAIKQVLSWIGEKSNG